MPLNWPPPDAPPWPPPEISDTWLSCSNLKVLIAVALEAGFTHEQPTPQENNLYFKDARCDHGDKVTGRMIVSPDGLRRYPFAMCNDNIHKDVLVLWPPYYCGAKSMNFEFVG